ncbi:MAG TPA: DUF4198 domain-containing protein [Chitinophagaceae bacterium]|nr:DUF4198 domain-containing protein [Chitinophagaceae bacterium]
MPLRKISSILFLLTFISPLSAHEFWLNPHKFIYKSGEPVTIRFLAGENFEGENWSGNNERIRSLKLYFSGVNDDLSKFITGAFGDSIEYIMVDEGTNLIAYHGNNSFVELDPSKFNAYLEEDGLLNAIEFRKQHNEMGCNGREFYQRCAKALIQVGETKNKTYSIPTTLPVDIIPLSNPYLLKNKEPFRVKILYKKSPLANTLIKVWHRRKDKTEKEELTSDSNGEISFPVTTNGKWMISTVKMERLNDNPLADWQSYRGSLTWGYE